MNSGGHTMRVPLTAIATDTEDGGSVTPEVGDKVSISMTGTVQSIEGDSAMVAVDGQEPMNEDAEMENYARQMMEE